MHGQSNLADMYINGKGVTRDPDRALAFLIAVAENGHAYSQYILGEFYLGSGDDRAKTQRYLRAAADQNHGNADLWRTIPQALFDLQEVRAFEGGEVMAAEIERWLEAISRNYPLTRSSS